MGHSHLRIKVSERGMLVSERLERYIGHLTRRPMIGLFAQHDVEHIEEAQNTGSGQWQEAQQTRQEQRDRLARPRLRGNAADADLNRAALDQIALAGDIRAPGPDFDRCRRVELRDLLR